MAAQEPMDSDHSRVRSRTSGRNRWGTERNGHAELGGHWNQGISIEYPWRQNQSKAWLILVVDTTHRLTSRDMDVLTCLVFGTCSSQGPCDVFVRCELGRSETTPVRRRGRMAGGSLRTMLNMKICIAQHFPHTK